MCQMKTTDAVSEFYSIGYPEVSNFQLSTLPTIYPYYFVITTLSYAVLWWCDNYDCG